MHATGLQNVFQYFNERKWIIATRAAVVLFRKEGRSSVHMFKLYKSIKFSLKILLAKVMASASVK
jgi:hypothetical protein